MTYTVSTLPGISRRLAEIRFPQVGPDRSEPLSAVQNYSTRMFAPICSPPCSPLRKADSERPMTYADRCADRADRGGSRDAICHSYDPELVVMIEFSGF